MFQDITKPPPSLPTIELLRVDTGVSVLSPLVRRGTGPPLIILTANNDDSTKIVEGVPSHLVKWAEEGFTVAEIQQHALEEHAAGALKRSIQALRENPKCEPKDNIGLVGEYCPELLTEFENSRYHVHSVRTSFMEPGCRCCQRQTRYQGCSNLRRCLGKSCYISFKGGCFASFGRQ